MRPDKVHVDFIEREDDLTIVGMVDYASFNQCLTALVNTASESMDNGGFASFGEKEARHMLKSSITIEDIPNPTPGEMLLLDFIEPMGLSQNGLARAIGVPPRRINEIVLGKRSITADTDLRLARYFGVSEGFWLGLQSDHDLMRQRDKIAAELSRISPHAHAA